MIEHGERDAVGGGRLLNGAIVGAGRGCESILRMVHEDALERFRMRVLGVADVRADAPGMRYAREIGIPLVTTDHRQLFGIEGLDFIIELTGRDGVRQALERERPPHVHLIDHFAARFFWELHQAEQAIIDQRTEMREQVEAERERIAQILDSIPDEILVVDTEMVIQDANSSFLQNNDLRIGDVRGCHCYEVEQEVRGECQVAVENCPFFRVIKEAGPVSLVRKHFDDLGQARYAAIVGAPLRDHDGEVVGMIEMTRDITHRIRLEEQLATSEVRLQQFMELAPLATFVKNRSGQYIDVNPAACAMFGKRDSEILGKTDREIFTRQAAGQMRTGDQRAWKQRGAVSVNIELELDQRRIFLDTVKFPILDATGKPVALCGLARDVTAQREAERKLEETREYLQNILDNSPVIIVTTDLEGRIVSFNRGAEESLGYKSEEVIGQPASIFYTDSSQRDELLRQVVGGRAVRDYTVELLRKDETPLPVSLTLSQLCNANGEMIGTVGISKDISHRQALMQQILQSERMAAVGRLASGVAHEINNPLAVISEIVGFLNDLVNAEVSMEGIDLTQELKEGLPKVLQQVKRGRTITQRLLTFARKSEAQVDVADANRSLDEILPFLEKEARLAEVTIHRDYAENLPQVAVEEMQLQEVFINLVNNAIQALAEQGGGDIWLQTGTEGNKVVISIRDNGPGIDQSVRDRLFDPFVSTKPTGVGTGLGLSICYGIVKRYDGEIRVESEPGEGATFKVYFPAYNPTPSKPPQEQPAATEG